MASLPDSPALAPLWRRALYRIGLALNSELEEAEHALMYARGDLRQAQSRFQAMQREIDELRHERALRAYEDAKAKRDAERTP